MVNLVVRLVQRGDGRRLTSRRRNSHQTPGAAGEQDHAIAVPVAGDKTSRQVADGLRRSAVHVDLPQLTCGLESEKAAVRSPEGVRAAIRTRQHAGFEETERPNPEPGVAFGV